MIKRFVDKFMEKKPELEAVFSAKHPKNYKAIVQAVVNVLHKKNSENHPDPKRIHEIDDGAYQGLLLYVIGSSEYQPETYWLVKVDYGSCSGCDTLETIRCYPELKRPTHEQVDAYMTLALHIVQGLKKISGEPIR